MYLILFSRQFSDQLSQQDYAEVTSTLLKQYDISPSGGNTGHACHCAPLQLALFISPLYLLLPFRIVKQSFHRRSVIDVSHRLGPHKPQVLLKVENLIWDAVFSIAERPLDIKAIISKLVLQIPQDDMESASPGDRSWFNLFDGRALLLVTPA